MASWLRLRNAGRLVLTRLMICYSTQTHKLRPLTLTLFNNVVDMSSLGLKWLTWCDCLSKYCPFFLFVCQNEELSQANIRIGLLEKRLENINKEVSEDLLYNYSVLCDSRSNQLLSSTIGDIIILSVCWVLLEVTEAIEWSGGHSIITTCFG